MLSRILLAILCFFSTQLAIAQDTKHTVGDWWVLRATNGAIETVTVSEIAPNGDFTLVTEAGKLYAIYTSGLNIKQRGSYKYEPHNGMVSFPLTPGKTWDETIAVNSPRGNGQIRVQGQVKGPEEITLKLVDGAEKKLSTTRIENIVTVRNWPSKITCWYATEIQFVAKCSTDDKDYLVWEVAAYGKTGDQKPKY